MLTLKSTKLVAPIKKLQMLIRGKITITKIHQGRRLVDSLRTS